MENIEERNEEQSEKSLLDAIENKIAEEIEDLKFFANNENYTAKNAKTIFEKLKNFIGK